MGKRIGVNPPTPEPRADAGGSRATGRWRSVGPTRDAIRLYQWPSQAARLFGCRARNPSGPAARRRVTGRTHDRIRTAAEIPSYPLEPRRIKQDDYEGSQINDGPSRECRAGSPGVPKCGALAGRPQGRFAPRKGAVASRGGEALLDRSQPTRQQGFRPGQENGAPAEQENTAPARKRKDNPRATRQGHPDISAPHRHMFVQPT